MRVTVEFVGLIQRGNWAQVQSFDDVQPGTSLAGFLVAIGYAQEHLRHIIIMRNDTVTQDLETILADGDAIKLSILLGGG